MSVNPSNLIFLGCASMPEADGSTVGGAPDFTKRVDFSDVSPTGLMDVVSSSASDTATQIIYSGRAANGAVQSETLTLNGQTVVNGTKTLQRLLSALLSNATSAFGLTAPSGTAAVGDVALISHTAVISAHTAQAGSANPTGITPALIKLQAGDGATAAVDQIIRTTGGTGPNQIKKIIAVSGYGTDVVAVTGTWGTIPDATTTYNVSEGFFFEQATPPVTAVTRLFVGSGSDVAGGSQRIFYEKVFAVNTNTVTALSPQSPNSGVGFQVLSESPSLPSGVLLDAGPAASFNDSLTIANRQTAPAGIVFTTQPANVFAPSPGALQQGAAPNTAGTWGLWLRLTVPAGAAPYNGVATLQLSGATI